MAADVFRNGILRNSDNPIADSHTGQHFLGEKLINERNRDWLITADLAGRFGLIDQRSGLLASNRSYLLLLAPSRFEPFTTDAGFDFLDVGQKIRRRLAVNSERLENPG